MLHVLFKRPGFAFGNLNLKVGLGLDLSELLILVEECPGCFFIALSVANVL